MKNPKIFIPLIIILMALGAFAATTMTGGDGSSGDHGHSHGEHGHEH